jgi:aldose 1-epimerase
MLSLSSQPFGTTQEGELVSLYTLGNRTGMEVAISNYGGTIVSLRVPDRNARAEDIVLGYDKLEDYEQGLSFFGATIGRYANRIANGKFTIGKKNYLLTRNDGRNTLHGGTRGLGKRVWAARQASTRSKQTLQLTYLSRDGEEGFPGNLSVIATFSVPVGRNELCIDYTATTDKNTVLNLTNHSYFNPGGTGKGDVLTHRLRICGQQFTPIDTEMIPTGEFRNVVGTPFDFIQPTAIGEHIHADNEQLKYGKGYDHNWVLDSKPANAFDLAAEIHEPESGRMLSIFTTEPGIQFYAGNFLDGSIQGKGGKVYKHRSAFCLETQHFPDSPNHPEFPPTVLKPGRAFHSGTVYRFSLRQQP